MKSSKWEFAQLMKGGHPLEGKHKLVNGFNIPDTEPNMIELKTSEG